MPYKHAIFRQLVALRLAKYR